jgi:acyl carrier protein
LNFTNNPSRAFQSAKKITENILENIKTFINIGGLYKQDRIVITEDDRGVFDFGLASLGLYRPIEFYSEQLKIDIEKEIVENPYKFQKYPNGLINAKDIVKKIIGEKILYNFKLGKKTYLCERRQKGTTLVFNNFSNLCYLSTNIDGIIMPFDKETNKVFNGQGKIRLKYASSNKKSYLIYNKKSDSVKYVDIFIPVNYLTIPNDGRVIALITPLIVAGALEQYGVKVRISAMRIGTDESILTSISIPVKDYDESVNESLDKAFNILGNGDVASSFFAFFKTYFQANSVQTAKQPNQSESFYRVRYYEQDYMNEMMQRYKNWARQNKGASFINTKVENENFQFAVKQNDTGDSDTTTYEYILQNIHNIFYKFYYYMDFLALEMIPIQDFVKQVYRRYLEDKTFNSLFELPVTTKGKKEMIRNYVLKMLVEKYSYVKGGAYADTLLQEKEKDENFKSKLTLLDEAINSL